ncbi:type 1 fimbrial major subunit FimA [Pantoea sp. 1.19]|uniref:type 1 fimbrial major subunit FimA n=1 Tax=Pantoea sp. 1.19 TaxID=1925589 RepID=UPI00111513BA|nr:type 1 fimbrial major subunit FimA [Pantoea sp. 1.19]
MKKKLTFSLLCLSLFSVAGVSYAEGETTEDPPASTATVVNGGTVHFKGELVNAACAVSTTSADQIVNLGQYRTATFAQKGDTSAKIPFNIQLTNCDSSVATTAAVAFTGTLDQTDKTLLAISSGGNSTTATGVGIEILDSEMNTLAPDGSSYSVAKNLIKGNNVLPFTARYKATATTATAGTANADATFVLKYE